MGHKGKDIVCEKYFGMLLRDCISIIIIIKLK